MSSVAPLRPTLDAGFYQDLFSHPDDILGKLLLEQLNMHWSLVGDHAFFEPKLFPWIEKLEANWLTIRGELENVLSWRGELPNLQDVSKEYEVLTSDDLWKTFIFFGYGHRNEKSCRRCPLTTSLLEQVPQIQSAVFSVLGPHKHIPKHRGLYKGILRYHLGLIVPEPATACRISVNDEIRHWKEGESLIFDDSYQHEVWNDTDKHRIVLIVDIPRPLPFPISAINDVAIERISYWPFIREAMDRYRQWESSLPEAR